MMSQDREDIVIFVSAPTITAKHYIVKSGAGWPETFDRKKADAELARFLSPIEPDEVAEMFVEARSLGERHADRIIAWHTIVGHLSRLTSVRHDLVPIPVAIAFWARVSMAQSRLKEGN